MKSAFDLYNLGTHVIQYRSPDYRAEEYYKESLLRDEKFVPSMVALAEIYYAKFKFEKALSYVDAAEKISCEYNSRTESGRLYYIKGLILSALNKGDKAYDYFYKAYFACDYKNVALLRIGLADIKRKDYKKAAERFTECLACNAYSPIAAAYSAYSEYLSGDKEKALKSLEESLQADRVNLYALSFKAIITDDYESFVKGIKTYITQDVLDICEYLYESGLYGEIIKLVDGVNTFTKLKAMPLYLSDYLKGKAVKEYTDEGIAFPSRIFEMKVLEEIAAKSDIFTVNYYLGTLYYGRGNYEKGLDNFIKADKIKDDYRVKRNLAVAYYSHFNDKDKAKKYMDESVALSDKNEKQMTFEYAYFLAKTGEDPEKIIEFIQGRNTDRDEIYVELARAYNHLGKPEKAIETLMSRNFVACEGGEHYIADQYMFAYYLKGKELYLRKEYKKATEELTNALTLPQSLGSGLWNDIKKTPYLYFIAKCYDKLGEKDKAREVLQSFTHYKFDYFTNMYLYTYRYYLAKAFEYLGNKKKADELISDGISADLKDIEKVDSGYFATTPFFISYMDDNKTAREVYFAYRLYLYYAYLGDKENADKYKAEYLQDKYSTYIEDFTEQE